MDSDASGSFGSAAQLSSLPAPSANCSGLDSCKTVVGPFAFGKVGFGQLHGSTAASAYICLYSFGLK